jgi:3-hydroxypropionate dehydrogenase (NADP+)
VFNRLAAALWREALDLLDKGVATVEDIDKAVHAGMGLRWAITGPFLTYHLGGGEDGLEYFIDHLGPAFSAWWKSMANWTSIPHSAAKKAVDGVKQMDIAKEKTYEELVEWRDKNSQFPQEPKTRPIETEFNLRLIRKLICFDL